MHPGQKIHSSFLLASGEDARKYIPKARPFDEDKDKFWVTLRREGISSNFAAQWLEVDLYESTQVIVESYFTGSDPAALQRMCEIATSGKNSRFITSF